MPTITQIHKHRRKRQHQKLEPYPHPKKKFKILDRTVDVVSIVFPFIILPQIYEIWVKKNVEGVSFITWLLFLLFTIPLFFYAYVHKEKKLALMYGLFFIVHAIVIIGILVVS
tara:strand:- start:1954 stop:2292 length:339 start_codon:yes stop_codon:yes gene_type:complete